MLLKVKYIAFGGALIFATIMDIRLREIPDIVHVIICIATVLTDFSIIRSFTGLIFISIPFIVPIYFDFNGVGGGDIKLAAALGFFLGFKKGLQAVILGLSIAMIFNLFVFHKRGKDIFPLAPYLTAGSFLTLLFF